MGPRIWQLAKNLINYSIDLKVGERVLIRATNSGAFPLAEALIRAAYEAGGLPFVELYDARVTRAFMMRGTTEQFELEEKFDLARIKEMQAYIGFGAPENRFELVDVPNENMRRASTIGKPSLMHRVRHTKWCVLRYPTASMAESAEMSSEAFEEFFYNVCLLDYAKMSQAMDALVTLMNKTDMVRILGPKTDLVFSIKDIPAIKCDGKYNIPDGEVFTAPVRESINGLIYFTAPTIYESKRFGGIQLKFVDGRIVEATCEQGSEKDLNEILGRDEGARYVGEFAFGINPLIKKAMLNILFDEKIVGSFHLTPGCCYDEASNGNDSQIHWDMVCIQMPEYGGGEIYFDECLIRKDGRFIVSELEALNPENLL